ncbi:MAG: glycosyltransferase [Eubacteriales bacterium]|nr:glycosyltransferase [Eubacteriales bacterium]
MAEVSIIVPVYQVENYIRQCVDSILAQTFTDFELILVDDGSKDQSGKICDEYVLIDERVKVIHQTNSGAATARNSGMNQAVGNYFMFVDSDDYIAPTMLECLHKTILNEKADMVVCNCLYFFESDEKKDFCTNMKLETLSGMEIFYNRKNERNYGIWTVVWNKLIKKEIVQKVKFRSGKYYEDEFWANDIYQMDIKVVTIPDCLYYYRQHDDSTMKKKNIKKNFDIVEALQERIYIYLKEEKYSDQAYKVFIYSLEYLEESKRMITNQEEQDKFIQAEKRTKDIVKQLKQRKLSKMKSVSLVFMGINPCLVFVVGMKFRGLLERFL